jgi:hypothetical protein
VLRLSIIHCQRQTDDLESQEILRGASFGKSGSLWLAYLDWLKFEVLGGVKGRTSLLDIRKAHNEAMQVANESTSTKKQN